MTATSSFLLDLLPKKFHKTVDRQPPPGFRARQAIGFVERIELGRHHNLGTGANSGL